MIIQPIEDRIVVQPDPIQTTSKHGLKLDSSSQKEVQYGRVVACGGGRFEFGIKIPMEIKEGDRILFRKYAGIEVPLSQGGNNVVLMRPEDIYAVITEEEGEKQ